MVMSKTVLLKIPSKLTRRRSGKYNFFQGSQVRCFDFNQKRLWGGIRAYGAIFEMSIKNYRYKNIIEIGVEL